MKLGRWLVLLAVGAALTAVPGGALGSVSHAESNSQSFPDSTGEDASAPDITSVDVSNDDAGNLTFKINISNRPALTEDMGILVYLNTDESASTGDPKLFGADYVIELDPGAVSLYQWNGTTYATAASQSSLTYGYDATGATIHVSAADLGKTKTLGFVAEALSGLATDASGNLDVTNAHADVAPDAGHGLWSYAVLTKLSLKQTAFTTAPRPAKAGARFSASLAATESDTNGPVAHATIACVATLKGTRLRATHSLANGVVSCFWKLPKTAKGRTLHGTVTVVVQGTTLTKSFAAKIR